MTQKEFDESDATSDRSNTLSIRGELVNIEKVGMGGMAEIYRAHQPSLDRFVAIKKLKTELQAHTETIQRFRREAKALASVLHQNIAHVYDYAESDNDFFILMEYIEGFDLSTIIKKTGNLPHDIAAAIMLGLSRGVDYLHSHDFIHRDVKPSNVRLTNRGGVKLMDFGIVIDVKDDGLTRPGMLVGSPHYLSPEQVIGDPITPKADQFLLGITFYEILTGTKPFKEQGGETVYQRIRQANYLPMREHYSKIPKALDNIVKRCLKKDPKDRYRSVKGLIEDLEDYLGPSKSSHTEDLILKFLDDEGFVQNSNAETEFDERTKTKIKKPNKKTLLLVLVGALAYFSGYLHHWLSVKKTDGTVKSLDYPQPKPLNPSRNTNSLKKSRR